LIAASESIKRWLYYLSMCAMIYAYRANKQQLSELQWLSSRIA